MRIKHNIPGLNTYNKLDKSNKKIANSMEKLSSGLRINKSSDDTAGLAISEKMRGQIRGLSQADRNIQDGISLIQTAEGGLNEVHSALQRIRELTVQAANDTNTSSDRVEIKQEIDQLNEGINNIANRTHFNTIPLLNRTLKSELIGEITVIDGSEVQLTSDSNYDTQPSWIGDKIAFTRGSDIYTMDSNGDNESLLISSASQPSISNDGSKIAYVRSDGNLYISNINGSGESQLTNISNVNADSTFGSPIEWNSASSDIYF